MLRRKLNGIKTAEIPDQYAELIESLKTALAQCDSLYSKGYNEDDEETVSFIETELSELVDVINEIIDG